MVRPSLQLHFNLIVSHFGFFVIYDIMRLETIKSDLESLKSLSNPIDRVKELIVDLEKLVARKEAILKLHEEQEEERKKRQSRREECRKMIEQGHGVETVSVCEKYL